MLGWFTNKKTLKKELFNVTSVKCEGYGIEYSGTHVKSGKVIPIGYHSDYWPYGKPLKSFPKIKL